MNQTTESILTRNAGKAVRVFNTITERLNELGFDTPKCYDPKKKGGIFGQKIRSSANIKTDVIGKIKESPDPIYESKKDKYIDFVSGKILAMNEDDLERSELGTFEFNIQNKDGKTVTVTVNVAGGVRFYISGLGAVYLAFSGRTPEVDQAIVCLAAYKSDITGKAFINKLYEQTGNPLLEWNMFGALLSEM